MPLLSFLSFFFFFNDTATTEIYTLSLHDALPIYQPTRTRSPKPSASSDVFWPEQYLVSDIASARVWTYGYNADVIGGLFQSNNKNRDRKSTRLNSSHDQISYAVFCLKKKKKTIIKDRPYSTYPRTRLRSERGPLEHIYSLDA